MNDEAADRYKSILIVDDDEMVVTMLRPILISNGYAVLSAETGEIGLEIARKQKPDLICLDIILPGIKGRDVCRELKEDEETKDIPVIFLTSKNSEDDIKAGQELGAVAHLNKPVNTEELIATLNRILKS